MDKKGLIKFAAEWWAGMILLKKVGWISCKDDENNPFAKRIAPMAEKQITDESLGKFIKYFCDNAELYSNECRNKLKVDYHSYGDFLRECFEAAGIQEFFFAPKKCFTTLNLEEGFFAVWPDTTEKDTEWVVRAKTDDCKVDFKELGYNKVCLYEG